VSKYKQAGSC